MGLPGRTAAPDRPPANHPERPFLGSPNRQSQVRVVFGHEVDGVSVLGIHSIAVGVGE